MFTRWKEWLKKSGVIIPLIGVMWSGLWKLINYLGSWLISQFVTVTVVDQTNALYSIFEDWVSMQPFAPRGSRFEAFTFYSDDESTPSDQPVPVAGASLSSNSEERKAQEEIKKEKGCGIILKPAMPVQYFWYRKHFVQCAHVTHKPEARHEGARHTMEIRTFGRDRTVGRQLLEQALWESVWANQDRVRVYVSHKRQWKQVANRRMRRPESVILDEGIMEDLISDATSFFLSAGYYEEKGIPHRRGYGFWGPPGTGKTSILQVLSGVLNMPMYILRLSSDSMSDDDMESLVQNTPRRCLLVIEDIDAAFRKRTYQLNSNKSGGMTFSGLLNILDGVASQEGRIVAMTSNHPERLAKALRRPGRVDREWYIGYASKNQIERLFEWFFQLAPAVQAQEFAEVVSQYQVSPARVIQYLMLHRDSADEAHMNRMQFMEMTHDPEAEDGENRDTEDEEIVVHCRYCGRADKFRPSEMTSEMTVKDGVDYSLYGNESQSSAMIDYDDESEDS